MRRATEAAEREDTFDVDDPIEKLWALTDVIVDARLSCIALRDDERYEKLDELEEVLTRQANAARCQMSMREEGIERERGKGHGESTKATAGGHLPLPPMTREPFSMMVAEHAQPSRA